MRRVSQTPLHDFNKEPGNKHSILEDWIVHAMGIFIFSATVNAKMFGEMKDFECLAESLKKD